MFQVNACNYCDDIFAETADVAFGDGWLPEYKMDWQGTNVVVSRHPDIDEIIADAAAVWSTPADRRPGRRDAGRQLPPPPGRALGASARRRRRGAVGARQARAGLARGHRSAAGEAHPPAPAHLRRESRRVRRRAGARARSRSSSKPDAAAPEAVRERLAGQSSAARSAAPPQALTRAQACAAGTSPRQRRSDRHQGAPVRGRERRRT